MEHTINYAENLAATIKINKIGVNKEKDRLEAHYRITRINTDTEEVLGSEEGIAHTPKSEIEGFGTMTNDETDRMNAYSI